MTERNIATEVLDGLHEVREHRAGKRTLKTVRVEPTAPPGAHTRGHPQHPRPSGRL